MYQDTATKVLTGEVRLSYANLNEPRAQSPGATPKYSVSLLIPKTDTATVENIRASIEAAAAEAQGKKWNGYRPPNIYSILHDGDGTKENGKPYGDECKGHWVLNASSHQKPEVVHVSDIKTQLLPNDIYGGMYARVTINFFGYAAPQKIGVGCGLGNVMKTRDGEPLAGNASAASDFAAGGNAVVQPQAPINAAAPWNTPQPPAYPQAPAQQAYQPPPQAYAPQQPAVNINPLTGQPM